MRMDRAELAGTGAALAFHAALIAALTLSLAHVTSTPEPPSMEVEFVEGEQRFVSLGINAFGVLMVVVWTPRGEKFRLISVRRAEPKERRDYEKGV